MQLAKKNNGSVTLSIARQVGHSLDQCHDMHRMLTGYSGLGKPTVVVEDGVRVTKCPPAYAGGVYPGWSVGAKGRS